MIVTLDPGDVLYIPPFWLHTATALDDSASLSLCSASVAQEAAEDLEYLPLPLELVSLSSIHVF